MDRTIIPLDETHRAAAVATLAAAFQDDPAVSWIIPDPAARARRLLKMYDWLFSDHLTHGFILGTPGAEAVTLWRAPGKVHTRTPLRPGHLLHLLQKNTTGAGSPCRRDNCEIIQKNGTNFMSGWFDI